MRKENFLCFWSVVVLIYFIYLFGLEQPLETYVYKPKQMQTKCKQTGFGNRCFLYEGADEIFLIRISSEFPFLWHLKM